MEEQDGCISDGYELEEDDYDYFDEESPSHRAKTAEGGDFAKRRKIEAELHASKENNGKVLAQATEILVNQVPEVEAKGSNDTMKPPSFAARMKPVAFNINPKVGVVSTSATKQPTKDAVTDQAALASEATVKPDNQQPSRAVTSLGLAYGSREDDSELASTT